jgi:hypothetical protein
VKVNLQIEISGWMRVFRTLFGIDDSIGVRLYKPATKSIEHNLFGPILCVYIVRLDYRESEKVGTSLEPVGLGSGMVWSCAISPLQTS